ncbi:retrovirus-related Pol polyprotein from transposon 17.6 [Trichonephila clavipes]|nr:retrovirus-related Pol polyprotein from transposon 17.6 [Trichonephila clavipes]
MVPYDLALTSELLTRSVSDDFPMEDAVDLIHSIGRANIFTTLDLLKGYWDIPMAEDSKNLTSFKTHRQQYHFKIIFTCIHRNHLQNLGRTTSSSGYYFNETFSVKFHCEPQKVCFRKTQIKYLGPIIGSGKHEPDPENNAVINSLPVPKTKKELRSALGLCNYYHEYIPKYSKLVYQLTELTKKRVPDSIPWIEKHDQQRTTNSITWLV